MNNTNIILRLNLIEQKVNNIDQKLTDLIILMNDNKRDCEKMSSHIDFIDSVYEKLKTPIDFVCNRINNTINNNLLKWIISFFPSSMSSTAILI